MGSMAQDDLKTLLQGKVVKVKEYKRISLSFNICHREALEFS